MADLQAGGCHRLHKGKQRARQRMCVKVPHRTHPRMVLRLHRLELWQLVKPLALHVHQQALGYAAAQDLYRGDARLELVHDGLRQAAVLASLGGGLDVHVSWLLGSQELLSCLCSGLGQDPCCSTHRPSNAIAAFISAAWQSALHKHHHTKT